MTEAKTYREALTINLSKLDFKLTFQHFKNNILKAINLSKLDFKFDLGITGFGSVGAINLSKLDFKLFTLKKVIIAV